MTGPRGRAQSQRPRQKTVVLTAPHRSPAGSVARNQRPPTSDGGDLDLIFSALSNPTRRAILARLSKGESTVGDLARPFDMSLPAISKHLRILEQARLITVSKEGRTHRCRLAPAPLANAERWLAFYGQMWNDQLDSLAKFLKESRGDAT
jgi:DNA-binding transcriptional ArsR family regulator